MKRNHIYVVLTSHGDCFEGIFVGSLFGRLFFKTLPFYFAECAPRSVLGFNIQSYRLVCQYTDTLSSEDYLNAVSLVYEDAP